MIGTGLSIQFLKGVPALIAIFVCYGCIMGIGLGVGYLTPVKTLMLWFKDKKGLATGISIMGFGLAKAIATPIMEAIQSGLGIAPMFYILGGVYFAMMFLGHLLLKKPEGWKEEESGSFSIKEMFKKREFLGIWLMFFLNIHCGLMLITYEKQILQTVFAGLAVLGIIVSVIPSVSSAFNALGRIGYSSLSDKLKQRNSIYKIIFISCIGACILSLVTGNAVIGVIMIILLFVINAGYGGGFSTLPALLSERFGMKKISKIHGLALSAWAIAGLTGNNMSELILGATGSTIAGYKWIILAILILYAVALIICWTMVGKKKGDIV
jgi:OFA family oxalate/formate antiporter-like MFS transporter